MILGVKVLIFLSSYCVFGFEFGCFLGKWCGLFDVLWC